LAKDYLSEIIEGQGNFLFEDNFLDRKLRSVRTLEATQRPIKSTILNELITLNNGSTQANKSLELLTAGKAAVVVTGQQIGLFGGPLLTIYKILGAISLARTLERESGVPVVPVFWMQSEDHDFAEISTAKILRHYWEVADFSLPESLTGVGDSVGKIMLDLKATEAIANFIDDIHRGEEAISLKNCYQSGRTLTAAFGEWIKVLFSRFGLLIFDPTSSVAKSEIKELIVSSFLRNSSISRVLSDRVKALQAAGFEIQVPLRPQSPLFFYSHEGSRIRLTESKSGDFEAERVVIPKNDIYQLIDQYPERFTASALIRPIYQDTLFPTVAYLAGPAEIRYWSQITPLYKFFNMRQPFVVPRPSLLLLEPRVRKLMEAERLTFEDLKLDQQQLVNRSLLGSKSDPELIFSSGLIKLQEVLRSVEIGATGANLNLQTALERTEKSIAKNLQLLRHKYEKLLRGKERVLLERFSKLQSALRPNGSTQERELSFISFLLPHGFALLDRLLVECDPLARFDLRQVVLDS